MLSTLLQCLLFSSPESLAIGSPKCYIAKPTRFQLPQLSRSEPFPLRSTISLQISTVSHWRSQQGNSICRKATVSPISGHKSYIWLATNCSVIVGVMPRWWARISWPPWQPLRSIPIGVPLVRPVVPPLTRARAHVHVPICTARATTPQSHIPSVSFLSCECVSFPLCDCRPTCLALTARSQQPRDSSATKISGCIRLLFRAISVSFP